MTQQLGILVAIISVGLLGFAGMIDPSGVDFAGMIDPSGVDFAGMIDPSGIR